MKITIDTDSQTISQENSAGTQSMNLYSRAAFEMLSHLWLKVGWNQKYTYTFSWLGRPIIQLPDDMVRLQEVIYRLKPDVILETGIAHGGSLIFSASLCKTIGKGRVIGVDIEIRPHNRKAIEDHELFPLITLVEGNSIDPQVVQKIKSLISDDEKVLIILDSCHSRDHVKGELDALHDLVSPGFYIVVADGFMKDLTDVPRGNKDWSWDNPITAAQEFLASHAEFILESQPAWVFNESELVKNVTHCPLAWLLRRSDGPV